MPAPWKTDEVVHIREVSDKEMVRLVVDHGDTPSRSGDDEVDGFFEEDDDKGLPRRSSCDRALTTRTPASCLRTNTATTSGKRRYPGRIETTTYALWKSARKETATS